VKLEKFLTKKSMRKLVRLEEESSIARWRPSRQFLAESPLATGHPPGSSVHTRCSRSTPDFSTTAV